MAKIIVTRKSKMGGCAQNHDVYLYNKYVGELKNGGTLEIPADVGTHLLTFKSKMKRVGKDATFTVNVSEESEIVPLKAGFAFSGDFIVDYADNKPHLPPVNNLNGGAPANTRPPLRNNSAICCRRCRSTNIVPISEVTTKGKDFRADNACCGYMLCGPLGLLFGATGKGKQTTTTTYWICKNCGNKFKA